MRIREISGLVLLIIGVTMLPFAYWLSVKWMMVSAAIIVVGIALYYTERVQRKEEELEKHSSGQGGNPNVPISGAARGFPGHRAFDDEPGPDGGADD